MTSRATSGLIAALFTATLLCQSAMAQTYGSVTLAPGFGTQTLTGLSGGAPGSQIEASTYGSTATGPCRGWIGVAPDHMMTVSAAISNLSIAITATDGGDTALLVSGPGGTWCNDDSVGLNPAIASGFGPGTYSIWVGSYSQQSRHPYTIEFSSLAEAPAIPVQTPDVPLLTTSLTPADPMGQLHLGRGFTPDPQSRSLTVTGTIDVSAVANLYGGNCRGHVMANPNHLVQARDDFPYLRVQVRSDQDTTLLMQDPDGGFWCNDDADGYNPMIEGAIRQGPWRIWVGTYSSGNSATYTIEFSEIPRR